MNSTQHEPKNTINNSSSASEQSVHGIMSYQNEVSHQSPEWPWSAPIHCKKFKYHKAHDGAVHVERAVNVDSLDLQRSVQWLQRLYFINRIQNNF